MSVGAMVKACPVCGNLVENTCFHDDRGEVSAESIRAVKAMELAIIAHDEAVADAESHQETIVMLARLIAE